MATPERRPESAAPAVVGEHHAHVAPLPPLEQTRDVGWVVTILGCVGALLGSWTLFSTDDASGMWAGYWVTSFVTLALLGTAWLRSSLPVLPGVATVAGSGAVLILVGGLRDYPTDITTVMVAGGVVIAIGAFLQGARHR